MIIRTTDEILKKIDEGFKNDFFGFGVSDIIMALPFDCAKQFLEEEFLNKPEAEEIYEKDRLKTKKDVLDRMEDYLPFAYDKAEDKRGLSADRSIQHYIAWAWLIDDEFYKWLENEYETNYHSYGLHILRKVENWINEQKVKA